MTQKESKKFEETLTGLLFQFQKYKSNLDDYQTNSPSVLNLVSDEIIRRKNEFYETIFKKKITLCSSSG